MDVLNALSQIKIKNLEKNLSCSGNGTAGATGIS
jgi:hypothetical protein